MTIKNIKDLRDHALKTLEKLDNREIDIQEAVTAAKMYSSIIGTIKTELEYHKMLDQKPYIEFLDAANIFESEPTLQLTQTRRIEK